MYLIKKLLSHSVKQKLKLFIYRFDHLLCRMFSLNGFTASIYYTFINTKFYREHQAVLRGRLAYDRGLRQISLSSALLRRNIHRLEKGLIMRPRRPVFALDYIEETVACFVKAASTADFCPLELQWATDVLHQYFQVVEQNSVVTAARTQFMKTLTPEPANAVPYPYSNLPVADCSYEQLLTLLQRRRSVRWFLSKPVEPEMLTRACNAAALAPSACNRQPYQFYAAHAEKAVELANCAMGTTGFAANFPCVVAIVGDLSAYPAERDRHVIYIDASLAAMQFMLALETLGLASCPINWPDIEARERQLSKLLGLAYYQRTVMLLAVGYADPEGGIAYSQKKPSAILLKDVR